MRAWSRNCLHEGRNKKNKRKREEDSEEKENTFGGIVGYDSDAVLMNKAIHKFFGHSGKYSQRKGRLKKIRYEAVVKEKKKKKKKEIPCGHGARIACMKKETKRIKGKEKKIQKRKMEKEKIEGENTGRKRNNGENSRERRKSNGEDTHSLEY